MAKLFRLLVPLIMAASTIVPGAKPAYAASQGFRQVGARSLGSGQASVYNGILSQIETVTPATIYDASAVAYWPGTFGEAGEFMQDGYLIHDGPCQDLNQPSFFASNFDVMGNMVTFPIGPCGSAGAAGALHVYEVEAEPIAACFGLGSVWYALIDGGFYSSFNTCSKVATPNQERSGFAMAEITRYTGPNSPDPDPRDVMGPTPFRGAIWQRIPFVGYKPAAHAMSWVTNADCPPYGIDAYTNNGMVVGNGEPCHNLNTVLW